MTPEARRSKHRQRINLLLYNIRAVKTIIRSDQNTASYKSQCRNGAIDYLNQLIDLRRELTFGTARELVDFCREMAASYTQQTGYYSYWLGNIDTFKYHGKYHIQKREPSKRLRKNPYRYRTSQVRRLKSKIKDCNSIW